VLCFRTLKGSPVFVTGKMKLDKPLVSKLAQLLFPFEELRPFDVFLAVNGIRIDLDRISRSVFDVADAQYTFSFDGKKLHIEGRYRLSILLQAQRGEYARQEIQRLLEPDQGADFYAYLTGTYLSQDGSRSIPGLKWDDEPGWFVSFEESHSLEDCGDIELVSAIPLGVLPSEKDLTGEIANPGPFRGVIYSFKRKGTYLSAISDVFNIQSEFSDYVERHSGVRVFRNGFGVRPFGLGDNDWLQLGSGWTSAISYYGLRPKNVVGYVALTAEDNSKLEEATDREGFVENAYLRNFHLLMQRVVKSITFANTNLRRGYNEYVRLKAEQKLGITSQSVSETFAQMRGTSSASRELETRIAKTRDGLDSVYTQVKTLTQAVESMPLFHTEQEREVVPLLEEIKGTLSEAASILRQVESMLSQAKQLGEIADVLEPDLEHLREELEMFSELAGLGMTAEALSHEISIIADGLAARTGSLLAKFKGRKSPDPQVVAYAEHVHTAVSRMRKQLGHLDPSMRYVRERRDKIEICAFFEDIHDFYSERLARNNIEMVIEEPFEDFTILMNKGKLTQVIDNLVLNSEYWLKEDLRKSHISAAKVLIRAKAPVIEIYDTGRGVAPSVEHYLFQPFVTMKPRGRGLGLFIARQLLDSGGCFISLLPERNHFDRRYIFRIDFTGAVINE
jgi:signal transduction histidine kinase